LPLPTTRALQVCALWLLLTAVLAFAAPQSAVWAYSGLLLAAIAAADAYLLYTQPVPMVRRQAAHAMSAGRWHEVKLLVSSDAPHAIGVHIHDHHPAGFEARDVSQTVIVPARGWAQVSYGIRSLTRGAFTFDRPALRLRSRLGLIERQVRSGAPQALRVYPDFGALAGYALLATDHKLSQMGILQRRRRGEGMDFHQLREYRLGDSLRRIDWKATARMHRLISREYQDERDQAIVILLDCGRRMAAADGEISHFDAALNAALLLAHVGVRHGDAVGALTMAGETRFIAPRKTQATVTMMLNQLYDLQPTLRTPDYYAAALDLMRRVRKRALVVVLSNLRDEDDDTLLPALNLLRRRHLVLFASLRERLLDEALAHRVHDLDSALTHAGAADYLQARITSFRRLERSGALLIDVQPTELPLALVNRYLDIKRTGLL